mmetsp:Transcript_14311/g.13818  ORF Transcript_14311/g.13818 Transcript_14311/m.13818 type:complete len:226 (+) Transcript_14311:315-992(+)
MSASAISDMITKYYNENTSSCNELLMISIIAGCLLVRCNYPSILLTILFVHYSFILSEFKQYNYILFILMVTVGMFGRKKIVRKDSTVSKSTEILKIESEIIKIMAEECPKISKKDVLEMILSYKGREEKLLDKISTEFGLVADLNNTGPSTPTITPSKKELNTPQTTTPKATTPAEPLSSDRYQNAREDAKSFHDQKLKERLEAREKIKTPKKYNNRRVSDDYE